jgi:6-phosphofructokinase 1
MMHESLGILVGGGPAPGINGVIEAATRVALSKSVQVVGIMEGFKWLSKGDYSHVRTLTFSDVADIQHTGGSILRTSRENPTKSEEKMGRVIEALKKLQIRYLMTIGGDDTSHSARMAAERSGGQILVAHVPKTIDNDLPLPLHAPTFGFETARTLGAQLIKNLIEDAKTSSRWYIAVSMGRASGFLGLAIGVSSGAPVTLVPEEFSPKTPLKTIVDLIEAAIIKRLSLGFDYGVCIVSEGVAEKIDPNDFSLMKDVGTDEHGNVKLAEVPLGQVLKTELEKSLKSVGIKMKLIPKDIGFELRCAPPLAFDMEYCRNLGAGAARFLIDQQGSHAMIAFVEGKILPIPFNELVDPKTGKTRIRVIDTQADYFQHALSLMDRVAQADFMRQDSLERLANAAQLTVERFIERYGYLVRA